jgi:hypothetical protein
MFPEFISSRLKKVFSEKIPKMGQLPGSGPLWLAGEL